MDKRTKHERMSTLVFCVIVLAISVCLRLFVLNTISVDGPSMQPTLYTGEHVMIYKLGTAFSLPHRYNIIVCKFVGGDKNYIKRVVALPGETVEVKDGETLVNGKPLADDKYGHGIRQQDMAQMTVPDNCVFVMGDNRGDSADSCVYGPVPRNLIEGIAFCVIWPLNAIKFL
jgi:signal peptidase I